MAKGRGSLTSMFAKPAPTQAQVQAGSGNSASASARRKRKVADLHTGEAAGYQSDETGDEVVDLTSD